MEVEQLIVYRRDSATTAGIELRDGRGFDGHRSKRHQDGGKSRSLNQLRSPRRRRRHHYLIDLEQRLSKQICNCAAKLAMCTPELPSCRRRKSQGDSKNV